MTSNDWSQTISVASNLATPDLFGGELFGDELMEMYNSDAVVGASNDMSNDMPALLSSAPPIYDSSSANEAQDLNHPGAEVAVTSTAIDDGLGAFRPSTSFSDLASLLPETTPSSVPSSTTAPASTVSTHSSFSSANEATLSQGQKRITASSSCGSKTSEPQQKKRATGSKRANTSVRRGSAKSSKASVAINVGETKSSIGKTALKLRKEHQASAQASSSVNNTPNPLSSGATPVTLRKSTNDQVPLPNPAVVTPRTGQKGDSITSEAAAAAAAVAAAASVPVPPPVLSSNATTEADFKSVAQAAVTNLILNAGASKTEGSEDSDSLDDSVDTSTAHIKALTSSNWVAACSGGSVGGNAAAAAADPKANRARRQNLTPDERARQNRDRNREHARNTRLRKKAYVEELKRTLTELVSQRDTADTEKRHSAQRELEQREVRFRVMEEFLKLRGRQETNYSRWVAILEDQFTLTLPITDFRKMVHADSVSKSEQTLKGASEAMGDAVHLGSFLQTLGSVNEGIVPSSPVTLQYQCDRKNFFMDGCNGVLTWTVTTFGAVGQGAPMELTLKGNMRAKFSQASNKLISAEILFDTGSIAPQLQLLNAPKLDRSEDLASKSDLIAAVAAAEAQAVANEADALLDSLQMPQLGSAVPVAITVMPTTQPVGTASAAVSVTSSDKDDSSDESFEDGPTHHMLHQLTVEG
mmetsp:Transcript_1185/g.1815  ORF Transcript_1185/g.1815 Transcript_1185/m.1815 type:complete len:700 (-) Transcript_1185:200-2299(-)|eukprot:CAMPEP_0194227366 /NCGR_PEP_ID=MMETSP0156-20130528/42820_1 /TAXON_ID=33649 /ORGANISM="Thalassionema nitzschioides, Strain L26-B" /LENGTH=699 /DNA_ID=CAMNT_0038959847 /DNA_START=697 /DNA_END=2796 /DNA_ORIENTATION=+